MSRLVAAVLTAAVLSAPVQAGWIGPAQYHGTGSGSNFNVTFGSTTKDVFAGELKYKLGSGTGTLLGLNENQMIHTYCVDLAINLITGTSNAEQMFLPTTNMVGTPAEQAAKASRLAWIASNIANLNETAKGSSPIASFTVSSTTYNANQVAAGIQLAIWDLLYDDGTNVNSGTFKVNSGNTGARNFANWVLGQSSMATSGWTGTYFKQTKVNDLTVAGQNFLGIGWSNNNPPSGFDNPIPAPPALVMGLIGFLSVAGLRRFRRV